MPIDVACPGCGSKLRAPDERAGKKAKCKKCNTHFYIPHSTLTTDSRDGSQLPPSEESVPMATAVEEDGFLPSSPAAPSPVNIPARSPTTPKPSRMGVNLQTPTPPLNPATKKPAQGSSGSPASASPTTVSSPFPEMRSAATSPPAGSPEEPLSLDDEQQLAHDTASDSHHSDDPFAFHSDALSAERSTSKSGKSVQKKSRQPQNDPPPASEGIENPAEEEPDPFATPFAYANETLALDAPFTFEAPKPADKISSSKTNRNEKARPSAPVEDSDQPISGPRTSHRLLLVVGALGMLALGGGLAVVMMSLKKDPEVAKKPADKKDDPPPAVAEPAPASDAKASTKDAPTASKEARPDSARRETGSAAMRKSRASANAPAGAYPATLLLSAKPITFRSASTKPVLTQGPTQIPIPVFAAFDSIKQFFPSSDRSKYDFLVVWQSNPGSNGRGERLTVDSYSAMTGVKLGQFEFEGDGQNLKCDASPDGKKFVAAVDGKVTVWELLNRTKILEGFDPYADKPEHKKAGLAAVFWPQNSNNFVTVTSAGVFNLFEIATKKMLAEYVPENAAAGRVAVGKNVSVDEARLTAVVAVGGAIHQVKLLDLTRSWKLDLGDAGRSFGIAVEGMPGRIAYAFETAADGKKERVILFCLPNGTPSLFRWPEAAGEPVRIVWSGADYIVVGTTSGVMWFEYDSERKYFAPMAMAKTPSGKALHGTTERAHLYLIPNPAFPSQSLILELPTPVYTGSEIGSESTLGQPLDLLRLDDKGLWK